MKGGFFIKEKDGKISMSNQPSNDESVDFQGFSLKITIPEIKKLLKRMGVKGYSSMKKPQMLALLSERANTDQPQEKKTRKPRKPRLEKKEKIYADTEAKNFLQSKVKEGQAKKMASKSSKPKKLNKSIFIEPKKEVKFDKLEEDEPSTEPVKKSVSIKARPKKSKPKKEEVDDERTVEDEMARGWVDFIQKYFTPEKIPKPSTLTPENENEFVKTTKNNKLKKQYIKLRDEFLVKKLKMAAEEREKNAKEKAKKDKEEQEKEDRGFDERLKERLEKDERKRILRGKNESDKIELAIKLIDEIFNVDPNSDGLETQVNKSFRKLGLKYHPDKMVNKPEKEKEEAKEYFQELQTYKELIMDFLPKIEERKARGSLNYKFKKRKGGGLTYKKFMKGGFYLRKGKKSGNVIVTDDKPNPFAQNVAALILSPTKKNIIKLLEKYNVSYKKTHVKQKLIDLLIDDINRSGTDEQKELIRKEGLSELKKRIKEAKAPKEDEQKAEEEAFQLKKQMQRDEEDSKEKKKKPPPPRPRGKPVPRGKKVVGSGWKDTASKIAKGIGTAAAAALLYDAYVNTSKKDFENIANFVGKVKDEAVDAYSTP